MDDRARKFALDPLRKMPRLNMWSVSPGFPVHAASRLVLAAGEGVLTMVEGVSLFEATPGDQCRRDRWRLQAAASVVARVRGDASGDVAARQAALRRYRAGRADR